MGFPGASRQSQPAETIPKRFLKARIDPQGPNKEPFCLARRVIPVYVSVHTQLSDPPLRDPRLGKQGGVTELGVVLVSWDQNFGKFWTILPLVQSIKPKIFSRLRRVSPLYRDPKTAKFSAAFGGRPQNRPIRISPESGLRKQGG